MVQVNRLPGQGCRHHIAGRCLYEEHLNPGYAAEYRCSVLVRWETAFDNFLERAESFNVAQDAVPDVWGRQFERMAREAFDCELYSYAPDVGAPACAHNHDGLCRHALPVCEGRCRHYAIQRSPE